MEALVQHLSCFDFFFYHQFFLSVSHIIETLLSEKYGYIERRVLCFKESQENIKARTQDHQKERFRVV